MRWQPPIPARRALPTLVAAVLAAAYLIIDPTGADLPAQLFRAKLFSIEGFGLWNNDWYGGHNLTAYSVLFPPLAALTSAQIVGALASVGTAATFELLAHDVYGDDAWIGATWLGAATVTELLSGRLTFALGLFGAALTALFLERRRPRWAATFALLTALASPVAALFAALAGATAALVGIRQARIGTGLRNTLGALPKLPPGVIAGAGVVFWALAPVVALAVAFPDGGTQPFTFATLWPVVLVGAGVAVAAQRGGGPTVTVPTVLYLVGCLLAYVIPTPVGANAARLGELMAGPVAALVLVPRRAWGWLALAVLPLAYLQGQASIGDLQKGWRAPYDSPAYYQPLIAFLEGRPGARARLWRVEVPFTAGHWEAYRLALAVPLARGWERQTDIADDPIFYGGRLDAGSYRRWLDQLAVRYVAVPDAPIDYSSKAEVRLIRGGPGYLRVVGRLGHWTVYAVAGPTPLASGAARVTDLGVDSVGLDVTRPGAAVVRVRFSPYWRLSGVRGCVEPAGAFTKVVADAAGTAKLSIAFALGRIDARSPRCN